jgi:hypothetical protein
MTDPANLVRKSASPSLSLRDAEWGLCWSNSGISDDVLVRKALISGGFTLILQACLEFGLDYVKIQWDILSQQAPEDSELKSIRTRSLVNDILENIDEGFSKASL